MTTPCSARTELRLPLAVLLLGGLLAAPVAANTPDERAAIETVQATVDEVLAVLNTEGLSNDQKRERIKDVALTRFDFPTISKLVLARNYRRMTPEQRAEFESEFKEHLALTYGGTIEDYQEQTVEIVGAQSHTNGDVSVDSVIEGGKEPVNVDYRLRKDDAGDWRVIDLIIEGVSMLQNFRSQVQEIVARDGTDKLLETLRQKNEERRRKQADA